MKKSLLRLENIHFQYSSETEILKNINLNLKEADILGIIGPNGGGKSTLLKIIVGLLTPTSGSIYYKDQLVTPPFPGLEFSYVPQSAKLNSILPIRVKDVIRMGMSKAQSESDYTSALELTGLIDKEDRLISTLSGGERQRALVARAIVCKPKILVLDEPTTGLDASGKDQLIELIEKVTKELGTSTVIVDHNITEVLKMCTKAICLNKTHHWHDKKELLNRDVINSIYHCEFEHELFHEVKGIDQDHSQCNHDHGKKKH